MGTAAAAWRGGHAAGSLRSSAGLARSLASCGPRGTGCPTLPAPPAPHRPVGADDGGAVQRVKRHAVPAPPQLTVLRLLLAAGQLHGAAGAQRVKHAAAAWGGAGGAGRGGGVAWAEGGPTAAGGGKARHPRRACKRSGAQRVSTAGVHSSCLSPHPRRPPPVRRHVGNQLLVAQRIAGARLAHRGRAQRVLSACGWGKGDARLRRGLDSTRQGRPEHGSEGASGGRRRASPPLAPLPPRWPAAPWPAWQGRVDRPQVRIGLEGALGGRRRAQGAGPSPAGARGPPAPLPACALRRPPLLQSVDVEIGLRCGSAILVHLATEPICIPGPDRSPTLHQLACTIGGERSSAPGPPAGPERGRLSTRRLSAACALGERPVHCRQRDQAYAGAPRAGLQSSSRRPPRPLRLRSFGGIRSSLQHPATLYWRPQQR